MKMMKLLYKKYLLILTMLVGMATPVYAAEPITVYAASSLTDAVKEIAMLYQKQHGVDINSVFGSSTTLAHEIEENAPADIFISADQESMNYCINKQKIASGTVYTLLGNNLVLITEKSSSVEKVDISDKTPWETLLGTGQLAVGDPDSVPAGKYARESLQSLGAWSRLESRLLKASDVRAAMALVSQKVAPLGIVYGSDALSGSDVKTVGIFPAASHKPVEYPVAIVQGHQTTVVKAFYDFLKTSEANSVFHKHGFTTLSDQ